MNPRFPPTIARFGVVAAVAMGIVGCGSGGSESVPKAATKAEFVERANEICDRANEVLKAAMVESFGAGEEPGDEAGIRFTHEVWVPNLREQDRDLRALDWPEADRLKIESMLDGVLRATDRVEAEPWLASKGLFDAVTRRMTDYGIGSCGSP